MENSLEDLRRKIAKIKEKQLEQRDLDEQLAQKEYELICATATMHVVVDDGKSIKTFSVSPELPTPTPWLKFTVDADRVVSAQTEFLDGSVTFFLSAGSQVSYEETDGLGVDESQVTIHVRAFATKEEAAAWADQRRQGNVSH